MGISDQQDRDGAGQERLGVNWRHAERRAQEGLEVSSIALSDGYYMTRRALEAAFKKTPGIEAGPAHARGTFFEDIGIRMFEGVKEHGELEDEVGMG
ncbi:hypothetical protein ACFXI8_27305 [Streptomyces niveus]|uniref:hypothetical protein n=1 Tax=Streptomyces niveus TaxID=193462 RepID=UPI0036831E73